MSLKRKIKILLQIVKGIKYLHKQNILHLDIKADNILKSKQGNVKICDFGEAYHPQYPFQREGIKFSVPFTAPEILRNNEVTHTADVFSFGVLAYEFLFGKLPILYNSYHQIGLFVLEGLFNLIQGFQLQCRIGLQNFLRPQKNIKSYAIYNFAMPLSKYSRPRPLSKQK